MSFNKIGFFTPVDYGSYKEQSNFQKVGQFAGNCLSFGGKKATVISLISSSGMSSRYKVKLDNGCKEGFLKSALKVFLLVTIIFPIIMLAIKLSHRAFNSFYECDPQLRHQSSFAMPLECEDPQEDPQEDPLEVEDDYVLKLVKMRLSNEKRTKKEYEAFNTDALRRSLGQGFEVDMKIKAELSSIVNGIFSRAVVDPKVNGELVKTGDRDKIVAKVEKFGQVYSGDTTVMTIKVAKGIIFKMNFGDSGVIKSRYKKMLLAEDVCRKKGLNLLKIPRAKMFSINVKLSDGARAKEVSVIAEQFLQVAPTEKAMEEDFYKQGAKLDGAIAQLAKFICETGYSDVEFRNNPVIRENNGPAKIALLDIEEMTEERVGLFGVSWPRRSGLVACAVSREQIDAVKKVARGYRLAINEEACTHRLGQLQQVSRLRKVA